jgi:predicted ATPase
MQTVSQSEHSLGWLFGTFWAQIHLYDDRRVRPLDVAMSGFETLAQIYREIGYPKLKNLKLTANIVVFTLCSAPA